MQFYDWFTQFEWCKSGQGPKLSEHYLKTPQIFYDAILGVVAQTGSSMFESVMGDAPVIEINHALCEKYWYQEDKPYFRVWPEMLEVLATTRINIPNKHLVMPYQTFTVHLPTDNELMVAPGYQMKSLLVTHLDERATGEGFKSNPCFYIWMDYGEVIGGEPIRAFQKGDFTDPEKDIESCFDLAMHPNYYVGISPDTAMRMAILRIVVGICLLATSSSKVIEPDILSRHLEQWKTANEARRKELVRKAIQRGKHGYRVKNPDHERVLVGNLMEAINDEQESKATGRPLRFSHLRRAHWHIVRHGPQHSLTKVMLFAETEVKKGLPRKEEM